MLSQAQHNIYSMRFTQYVSVIFMVVEVQDYRSQDVGINTTLLYIRNNMWCIL